MRTRDALQRKVLHYEAMALAADARGRGRLDAERRQPSNAGQLPNIFDAPRPRPRPGPADNSPYSPESEYIYISQA